MDSDILFYIRINHQARGTLQSPVDNVLGVLSLALVAVS